VTTWRMAFRCGSQGHDMWPYCRELSVAAIEYSSLELVDLSEHPPNEPGHLWNQLASGQKGSLRKVAYEMKEGDAIYVKRGTQIICRGIVRGTYQFDHQHRIVDPGRRVWAHQVPVDWETDFIPVNIKLGAEPTTVLELSGDRLQKMEAAASVRNRATYLLTWNPNRWEWEDIQEHIQEIDEKGYCELDWSCGTTERIKPGDRLFLLRQGREPRGIFASGKAVSRPYEEEHWAEDAAGRPALYVDIHLDVLLDPDREPIFPRSSLDQGTLARIHWDPRRSGVSIPYEVASRLEIEWARFLVGKNIVQQHTVEAQTLPEEVEEPQRYVEDAVRQTTVNAYERSPRARRACIRHYGLNCSVCGLDFETVYGDIGVDFIVVHHLRPLSEIGEEYELDPVRDLRPVCPNCHAMIHRRRPAYTMEEIKMRINQV